MVNRMDFSLYGILFVTSIAAGFVYVAIGLYRKGIQKQIIFYSLFLNLFTMIYGAKMFSVVTGGFQTSWFNAGISSLGGVLGLFLGMFLFGLIYKENKRCFLEMYITAMPLLYAISKLGCFSGGCCHGIPYDGYLSITYDNKLLKAGPLFPVQLAESVVFLCVFAVSLLLYWKKERTDSIYWTVLLCAVGKFSLEYLREEHIGKVISANQVVCAAFFLWAVYSILAGKRKTIAL